MTSVARLSRSLSFPVASPRSLRTRLRQVLSRCGRSSARTHERTVASFPCHVAVAIVLLTLSAQCGAAPLMSPPSSHRQNSATRLHENTTTGSVTTISTVDTSRTTSGKSFITVGLPSAGATTNDPRVARQLCTDSECCLITFMGTRSFFNPQYGLCEPYVTGPMQMMRESIEGRLFSVPAANQKPNPSLLQSFSLNPDPFQRPLSREQKSYR